MGAVVPVVESAPMGLVALDVDGTIVGPDGVFPAAVALLDELAVAAVPVALCSARPPGSLHVLARDHVAVRYVAGLQGAVVQRLRPDAAELGSWVIDVDVAAAVVIRARRRGCDVWWYASDQWFVTRRSAEVDAEIAAAWVDPVEVPSFDELAAPNKLLVIGHGGSVDGDLIAWCDQAGLATRTSGSRDLEVISGAVRPSKGLAVIAADLGVDAAAVVAVGDGDNDLGMLRFAGRPVAFPPLADTALWPEVTRLPAPAGGGLADLQRLLR